MKILQVTHFGTTTNYGAVLQAFALHKALLSLGHEPVLLRSDFSFHNKLKKWYKSPHIVLKAWIRKKMAEREERRHPRCFDRFYQDNMQLTDKIYHTIKEIKRESWDQFDAMVTGSDQVWSNKVPSDLYFLNFGPKNALRFSYAASVGTQAHNEPAYIEAFRSAVQKFLKISVREYSALELREKADVPAVMVPDPVFLFSREDYENFFHLPPKTQEQRRCLLYLVSENKHFPAKEVFDYCSEQGLTPVIVNAQNHLSDHQKNVSEIYPDIVRWVQNIRDADLVLTDSFHGTVFSILFGKRVVVFPKKNFDARFDVLERSFGIGPAIYRGDFRKAVDFQFPFAEIQEKISDLRKLGLQFLSEALDPKNRLVPITNAECCGCSLCAEICPKHCISMVPDEHGFSVPKIDLSACVHCDLCRKNCPLNQPDLPGSADFKYFYVTGKEPEFVRKSSSGGVFPLLAESVLRKGGAVAGVKLNQQFNAVLDVIERPEEISLLQGSKYVQASVVPGLFTRIKEMLEKGRPVLFSGTPCQVSAFRHFLGKKEYPALLLVDLICHGVPSPEVWQSYLSYLGRKSGFDIARVGSVSFRDKTEGWHDYALHIESKDGMVLYHCNHKKDPYLQLFINNTIVRDSCFHCAAKQGKSGADMTLGDFWKLKKIAPELDNNTGASLIIVHSKKGSEALHSIKYDVIQEMTSTSCLKNNTVFFQSCAENELTEKYFDAWNKKNKEWITDPAFFRKK